MEVRLERAREHLTDFKERLESFWHNDIDRVIDDGDSEIVYMLKVELPTADCGWPVFPGVMVISVLIGEIINHLRSCLDYLVYGLVWLDSKRFRKNSQFPIYKSPYDFERYGLPKIKGLSIEHVARIKELQPYNGCQWTRTVARLSNQDKHRQLIGFFASEELTLIVGARIPKRLDAQAEPDTGLRGPSYERKVTDLPAFIRWLSNNTVDVQPRLTGGITFDDGTPIVSTLEILQSQVAKLLSEFGYMFNPNRPVTGHY